jgi:hypothetical protein
MDRDGGAEIHGPGGPAQGLEPIHRLRATLTLQYGLAIA